MALMLYAAVHDATSRRPVRDMDGLEKLTVAQAADLLGTSQDAVRKRIQRNTIKWDKDDNGRIHVYLDASETSQATDQDESGTTVEVLREQVVYLQEVIRTRDEEIRRRDHLLAAALERIPAIEPPPDTPSEPRESPETVSEEEYEATTTPYVRRGPSEPLDQDPQPEPRESSAAASDAPGPIGSTLHEDSSSSQRSWWRKLFGS